MKVVAVDNLARESVAECIALLDAVPLTDLPLDQAQAVCGYLNACRWEGDERWYTVQEDGYRLWRGMADLVGDET